MTYLKPILHAPETAPEQVAPPAERVVSGDPSFQVWRQDDDRDGAIRSGIWQAAPGAFRIAKDGSYEFCHILQGVVELTEDGQPPMTYRAGDSFVMKPGFQGVWNSLEPVRKVFVISD
ncbi:MAG TPA: cupin domain-containing protein [Paenirhodobacter sp.]